MLRIALLLCFFALSAHAQNVAPVGGSGTILVACTGGSGDAALINAATAQARALSPQNTGTVTLQPSKVCNVTSTINLTSIQLQGFTIDGQGATILCATGGVPCIDGLNSRYVIVKNLSLYSPSSGGANIGIQGGDGVHPDFCLS